MLRPSLPKIVGAIVLGFALLLVASWFSPATRQICGHAYDTQEKNCSAYSMPLFIGIKIGEFLDAHSGAITAIATIAIALFTWILYTISKSELAHSHQVERAYISIGGFPEVRTTNLGTQTIPGVTGGGMTLDLGVVKKPSGLFQITLTNNGKTAGETLSLAFGFCETSKIPTMPQYAQQPFQKWIGPSTIDKLVYLIAIPKFSIPAIYGRVFYRDIFGRRHSSGFIHTIFGDGSSSHPLMAPAAYTEERDEP